MNQILKNKICILVAIIPYLFFAIFFASSVVFNNEIFFFFPLGIITLFPFSLLSLFLKKIWKVQFEDGTTKGDLTLLFFGILVFMGIPFGILAWMLLFVITL